MRKLYVATIEDMIEGIFDQDGTLLGHWHLNDGYWSDYFNSAFARLGFDVQRSQEGFLLDTLEKILIEEQGIDRNGETVS